MAHGPLLYSNLLSHLPRVRHGFTTRWGPDGQPWNMRLRPGDADGVLANRAQACRLVGVAATRLRLVDQVHGRTVIPADLDAPCQEPLVPGDALVTATPGVVLGVLVADCLPVYIVDTRTPAIALVHSGWRGTLAGIAGAAVQKLRELYDTHPVDCRCWIGPGIGPAAFEVGKDVAQQFDEAFAGRFTIRDCGARPHIDLRGAVVWGLQQSGVLPQHIEVSPLCTRSDPALCSYRRDGPDTPHALALLAIV